MSFKLKVLEAVKQDLSFRLATIQSEYLLYMESAANETKSTAGDKHDTTKSMMQMEQEKLSNQLKQLQEQKKHLDTMQASKKMDKIEFGALVETDSGYFLIAVPIRTFEIENKKVTGITMGSPIAQVMRTMKSGESFQYLNKTYKVVSIS